MSLALELGAVPPMGPLTLKFDRATLPFLKARGQTKNDFLSYIYFML